MATEAFIYEAIRTPRGKGKKGAGSLYEVKPIDLVTNLLETLKTRLDLDTTQVVAVAAFLRVINALENIRNSDKMLTKLIQGGSASGDRYLLDVAFADADDAVMVLRGAGIHGRAANYLVKACEMIEQAQRERSSGRRGDYALKAMMELEKARNELSG